MLAALAAGCFVTAAFRAADFETVFDGAAGAAAAVAAGLGALVVAGELGRSKGLMTDVKGGRWMNSNAPCKGVNRVASAASTADSSTSTMYTQRLLNLWAG